MAPIHILTKSRSFLHPHTFKSISTFTHLRQEAQLAAAEPPPSPSQSPELSPPPPPLPPNPATGSPLYSSNWRNPIPPSISNSALIPVGLGLQGFQSHQSQINLLSQTMDLQNLIDQFASWMTSQRWHDMKQLFEVWIRSLDKDGKPNKPNVGLYNLYLRANLMIGASAGDLLDLVAQMEEGYGITPNTASFNLVLKAMQIAKESVAAEKLIERFVVDGVGDFWLMGLCIS